MTKRTGNIALSLGMIAVAAAFYFERDLGYPSNVFPYAVLILITVLSLIILFRTWHSKTEASAESDKSGTTLQYGRVTAVAIASIVYIGVFFFIGFYVSSFLYLVVLSYILRPPEATLARRLASSSLMAVVVCALIYVMFDILLRVPTPEGVLF